MKPYKIVTILIFSCFILGCKSKSQSSGINNHFNSYDSNWKFFDLKQTIEARIISHLSSPALCGFIAFASVSIIETSEGKIFRVLDLCNNEKYKENDLVNITPIRKPEFDVMLPDITYFNPNTKKKEKLEINKQIVETTYGQIKKK